MGNYPVINLTLKDAKQPDFLLAYEALKWQIADEYARHQYILQDERLAAERDAYMEIRMRKADRSAYNNSIKFLSQCLEKYYGKKVIILIDEYDVPLAKANEKGYYEQMVTLLRKMFGNVLKTNDHLYLPF